MLRAQLVADWLLAQGLTDKVTTERDIPDMPDRLVVLTLGGGAGTALERALDRPILQVLCRGAQDQEEDAEALAEQVDDLLMGAVPPLVLGAGAGQRRIISIDYAGGGPQAVERDTARRTIFSTNYLLQVARSVF